MDWFLYDISLGREKVNFYFYFLQVRDIPSRHKTFQDLSELSSSYLVYLKHFKKSLRHLRTLFKLSDKLFWISLFKDVLQTSIVIRLQQDISKTSQNFLWIVLSRGSCFKIILKRRLIIVTWKIKIKVLLRAYKLRKYKLNI